MNYKIRPCPYCGKRQKVSQSELDRYAVMPTEFPQHYCNNCNYTSYLNPDLTLRKLTEAEKKIFKETLIEGYKYFAKQPQMGEGGFVLVFGSEKK